MTKKKVTVKEDGRRAHRNLREAKIYALEHKESLTDDEKRILKALKERNSK